uniref:PHD-type domain-containing protein n=1 Tax=Timema tahoe TaxID=61484 RepID=A0A7R9IP36_9NEOP|nr:unnamed protein product [Timema tahoe]
MTGNQGGKPSGIPKEQRFAHFYKPREVSLLLGNLLKENIFTAQVQSTRGSRFTVVQPTRLVSFSLGSEKPMLPVTAACVTCGLDGWGQQPVIPIQKLNRDIPSSLMECSVCYEIIHSDCVAKQLAGKDVQMASTEFLMYYRNTPQLTTGVAPVMLMMSRALRTPLDVINNGTDGQNNQSMEEIRAHLGSGALVRHHLSQMIAALPCSSQNISSPKESHWAMPYPPNCPIHRGEQDIGTGDDSLLPTPSPVIGDGSSQDMQGDSS